MYNRYRPREIPSLSGPITASNRRNAANHPAVELGACTASQLLSEASVNPSGGNICIIGDNIRGFSVLTPLIRRSGKPFLIVGAQGERTDVFMNLHPQWVLHSPQTELPEGNGAILLSDQSAYLGICHCFAQWSQDYYVILCLGGCVQAGFELMNLINASDCAVFCSSINQSLRSTDARTIPAEEFMRIFSYLLVYSAGNATADLIKLLPTYRYERVSNNLSFNSHRGRSFLHPFSGHGGFGFNMGQERATEYKKSLFEMDELQRIFADGTALLYNAGLNTVYLAQLP